MRSRYEDYQPTGRHFVITENDLAIFQLLQDFPYLPTTYIGALLGLRPTIITRYGRPVHRYEYILRRLTILRKEGGYIRVHPKAWPRKGDKDKPAVYQLTDKGKTELQKRKRSIRLGNDFAHDIGACLVVASFRLFLNHHPELRFIDEQEILDFEKCPHATRNADDPFNIPLTYSYRGKPIDGFKRHDWLPFGVAYNNRKIKFAGIEFDRDRENLTRETSDISSIERHISKILALLDYGYEEHFGEDRFWVPFVTTSQARAEKIQKLIYDLTDGKGCKHLILSWQQDWEDPRPFPLPSGKIWERDWIRAWDTPFNLLKELGVQEKGIAAE